MGGACAGVNPPAQLSDKSRIQETLKDGVAVFGEVMARVMQLRHRLVRQHGVSLVTGARASVVYSPAADPESELAAQEAGGVGPKT